MSKKDYTKFSKPNSEKHVESEIKQVVEEVVDEVVTEEEVMEVVEEVVPEVEEPKTVTGVVTDCIKLNVRRKPSPYADIVCKIDLLSEVVINEKESTNDFYKICTASGVEGYCMKNYIAISK